MDETNPLSPSQITRYSRQLILSNGFGVAGQLTLLSSSCLVVGAGGLGSSALLYLAGAGVGEIGIVDNDVVELTNLHRQVIHDAKAVGVSKAANARRRIEENPSTPESTPTNLPHLNDNALPRTRTFPAGLRYRAHARPR